MSTPDYLQPSSSSRTAVSGQPPTALSGALVISLDFELQWGVRDILLLTKEQQALLIRARELIPELLDVFDEFSIHATWAVVGLLFAHSKEEAEAFRPSKVPTYKDPRLDPFREVVGEDEREDPYHFAPSLISAIARRQNQELASHSFSHYYCMEAGQSDAEFEADLQSALAIAANSGHRLRSYVFPRNQVRPAYLPALRRGGVSAYRGNEEARAKASGARSQQRQPLRRAARWLDSYIDLYGHQTIAWPDHLQPASVGASCYLRFRHHAPMLDPLLLRRIELGIKHAAEHQRIFHLWWHPEDMVCDRAHGMRVLRHILGIFDQYRKASGMLSLSMGEVAELAESLADERLSVQGVASDAIKHP